MVQGCRDHVTHREPTSATHGDAPEKGLKSTLVEKFEEGTAGKVWRGHSMERFEEETLWKREEHTFEDPYGDAWRGAG